MSVLLREMGMIRVAAVSPALKVADVAFNLAVIEEATLQAEVPVYLDNALKYEVATPQPPLTALWVDGYLVVNTDTGVYVTTDGAKTWLVCCR